MHIKFKGWECESEWGQYGDKTIALTLMMGHTRVATATVCLWDPPPPPMPQDDQTYIWVKSWSENEGMIEALEASDVIEKQDSRPGWRAGYVMAYLCRLTPTALQSLNEARYPKGK